MADLYSTYEAKARFSEIIRKVRAGKTVSVTYRGEPVAEIRPLPKGGTSLEQRLNRLADDGILVRAGQRRGGLRRVARRPGALERFLADREA
ncbi:MAG: type II toxin-antitoxin system prevent-host-death family antitoxin [Gemmatimonadota bacterium]|nr:MAG: type II toxin-antitoxin system prevent-host-death family antitoxin [Gemmatimonadota bacterium]